MSVVYLIILSIAVQLLAGILALRLTKTIGWKVTWTFIAVAMILQAFRRILTLVGLLSGRLSPEQVAGNEILGLVLSIFMAIGVIGIGPFFRKLSSEVAERMRMANDRIKNEENYRNLIENTDDLVTIVDREGKFTFVNNASKKIFGLKPKECIGLSAFDFIHPDDRERTISEFGGWIRDKVVSVSCQNRQVSKTGQVFEVLWAVNPHFDSSGEVLELFNIAKDITERNKIEAQLLESKEQLQLAAQVTGFGVYDYNFVSGKAFYTPEHLVLYGLAPEATIELDADLVPKALYPDDKPVFLSHMKAANDPLGSGILDLEYRIIHPNGQVRWLRVRGKTMFSQNTPAGRPIRANGIIQDITGRKKLEEEAVNRLKELETYYKVSIGREERIIELKKEVEDLKKQLKK